MQRYVPSWEDKTCQSLPDCWRGHPKLLSSESSSTRTCFLQSLQVQIQLMIRVFRVLNGKMCL